MTVERQGTCLFCKQARFVDADSALEQRDVDELATKYCDCEQAQHLRAMERADAKFDAILGENCASKGFDHEVDEGVIEIIRGLCKHILCKTIGCVSISEWDGDTVKLTYKDGDIRVGRTSKKQVAV